MQCDLPLHLDVYLFMEVFASDDQVKVKFVDHGDKEDIPLSNLHYLEPKFFSLPPQVSPLCNTSSPLP